MNYKGPVVVVVMDGVGLSDRVEGNAEKAAYKPNLDRLYAVTRHSLVCDRLERIIFHLAGEKQVYGLGVGRSVEQPESKVPYGHRHERDRDVQYPIVLKSYPELFTHPSPRIPSRRYNER